MTTIAAPAENASTITILEPRWPLTATATEKTPSLTFRNLEQGRSGAIGVGHLVNALAVAHQGDQLIAMLSDVGYVLG